MQKEGKVVRRVKNGILCVLKRRLLIQIMSTHNVCYVSKVNHLRKGVRNKNQEERLYGKK